MNIVDGHSGRKKFFKGSGRKGDQGEGIEGYLKITKDEKEHLLKEKQLLFNMEKETKIKLSNIRSRLSFIKKRLKK